MLSKKTRKQTKPPSKAEERRAFVEEKALAMVALVVSAARDGSGMTRRALAGRLGVTEPRVSQILGADHGDLKVSTLARLADALGFELHVTFEPMKGSRR